MLLRRQSDSLDMTGNLGMEAAYISCECIDVWRMFARGIEWCTRNSSAVTIYAVTAGPPTYEGGPRLSISGGQIATLQSLDPFDPWISDGPGIQGDQETGGYGKRSDSRATTSERILA